VPLTAVASERKARWLWESGIFGIMLSGGGRVMARESIFHGILDVLGGLLTICSMMPGYESADRILEEYQHPRIGNRIPRASKVNETTAFKDRVFERNRWLLWEKPKARGHGIRIPPLR
jgi:hypothetical protein